jgi:hypothetical protein
LGSRFSLSLVPEMFRARFQFAIYFFLSKGCSSQPGEDFQWKAVEKACALPKERKPRVGHLLLSRSGTAPATITLGKGTSSVVPH